MRVILIALVACGPAGVESDAANVTDLVLQRRIIADSFEKPTTKGIPVAFFDADSTVRVSLSGAVTATHPTDVLLLPFIGERLAETARNGYLIYIVSNQGGGKVAIADAALTYTVQLIREAGGEVHGFDFAEHKDDYRKPGIGMATLCEKLLQDRFGPDVFIDKRASFMVGDSGWTEQETRPDGRPGFSFSNSDRLFAENYGIPYREPQEFFGWQTYGYEEFEKKEQVEQFWRDYQAGSAPTQASDAAATN